MALATEAKLAARRLELVGLRKKLGGTPVVSGIDLTVSEGESVVLLGPSGCGKTTTLRMVAGFIEPDDGEIWLGEKLASGRGVSIPTERRQLGMVFQSYAVWPHKTVHDNVAFSLSCRGDDRGRIRQQVERMLEVVQLGGYGRRYPGDLSGGQQQRVALARAIIGEPSLLLLDEPLSNLDAALREEMRLELKRLHRKRGMTMLYVTHDQDEALVLADRIAVMNGGRIEQLDPPERVYRQPVSRFVASFIGTTNLVEGQIVAMDPQACRMQVQSRLGEPFWASADAAFIAGSKAGDTVAAAVRPEDVLPKRQGGLPGRVIESLFLGTHYDLSIETAGTTLRSRVHRLGPEWDGPITVGFDPADAWIVP